MSTDSTSASNAASPRARSTSACATSRGGRFAAFAAVSAAFVAKSPWSGDFGRSSTTGGLPGTSASSAAASRASSALFGSCMFTDGEPAAGDGIGNPSF